jgi:hypothetical protein
MVYVWFIAGPCDVAGRGGGGGERALDTTTHMSTTSAVPELGSGTPTGTYVFGPWGGSQCIYTPLSASTSSKKLIPSWRLRQHAPGASRGLWPLASRRTSSLPTAMAGHEKQPSAGRWWGVVMAWLADAYSGWF